MDSAFWRTFFIANGCTAALILTALILSSCAAGPAVPRPLGFAPLPAAGSARTIFVISNGFHSAIVLSPADLPPGRIPEAGDFPNARYLEFGWGDAEYYPAKQATIGMTLRAALVPTPSVLHLAGLSAAPARSSGLEAS